MVRQHSLMAAIIATAMMLCPLTAKGGALTLVGRLPAGGNFLMSVDTVQFLKSPLAVYQGWGNTDPSRFPRTPNPLPETPGIQQIVLTQLIEPRTGQPGWEAAVFQMDRDIDLPAAAAARGGYMDTLDGRPLAVVRGDLFFMKLGDNIVGLTTPADRRFTAQWLRKPGGVSDYLRGAAAQTDVPIVLAMDLADTISETNALRILQDNGPISSVGADQPAVAKVLSGVRGFVVKISAGEATSNQQAGVQAVLDFSANAAPLAPMAKDLIIQIMEDRGLALPDIKQWDFAAKDNTITASGPLSVDSLRRILTLAHAPSPMAAPEVATTAAPPANANPGAQTIAPTGATDKVAASQKYFKVISQMLDDMRPGPSLKDNAGYLASNARRIDQLPILNVDPELISWGAYISSTFRDCGATFASGQQRVTAQVNGVAQPYTNYSNNNSGVQSNTSNELQAANDSRNASAQRRVAAANEKARVIDAISKTLLEAVDSRSKIRATMVQRYNVEF